MRGGIASIGLLILAIMAISYGLFSPPPEGLYIIAGGLAVAGLVGLSLWFRARAAALPEGLLRQRLRGRAALALSPILMAFFVAGLGISIHQLNQPWPGYDTGRFQGRPAAMSLQPTGEAGRKSLIVLPEAGGRWSGYDCHGEHQSRGGEKFRLACWSGSAMTRFPIGATLPVIDMWSREGRILGLTADGQVLVDLEAEGRAERETWWVGAVISSLVVLILLAIWIFELRRLLRARPGPKDIVS